MKTLLLVMIVGLLILAFATFVAGAHEAATGWEYDSYCCDDKDCRHYIPAFY